MNIRIGVLALQGGFSLHLTALQQLGIEHCRVRTPRDLTQIQGLIIPGGESTTIGMLMQRAGLIDAIRHAHTHGLALFGTCAGAITLARVIHGHRPPTLELMDIEIRRNAYGPQTESFEATIAPSASLHLPSPLRGVFIRAPIIERCAPQVSILARFEDRPVLVRQQRLLATTFHPELSNDWRLHTLFADICQRIPE